MNKYLLLLNLMAWTCPVMGADSQASLWETSLTLHDGAALGMLTIVSKLLNQGADPNTFAGDTTPLMNAAVYGHLDCFNALLTAGGDTQLTDGFGNTQVTMATRSGQPEILKILLKRNEITGSRLNELNESGNTLLIEAVKYRQLSCLQMLLGLSGIDLNKPDRDGCPPLICAIEAKNLPGIEALLSEGADTEKRDCIEMTPLMWASYKGYPFAVKALVKGGARLEAKSEEDETAAKIAYRRGELEIAAWLEGFELLSIPGPEED